MWLVQLHKAKEDASIGAVYVAESCERDYMANYIDPDEHTYELSLCNDWHYNNKKKLLILKKTQGTVLSTPRNERMIKYLFYHYYYYLSHNNDFIIFEHLAEEGFLMDFYVNTRIVNLTTIDADYTISGIGDLIRYIRGKTLNIRVRGEDEPKYSIQFDDDCRYYSVNQHTIIVIKKPFLIMLDYYVYVQRYNLYLYIYVVPKLIDDINDYDSSTSNYNPYTDQSINVYSIVDQYFDINNMSGVLHIDVNTDDNDNNAFGYNLIRCFLSSVTGAATANYEFYIDDTRLNFISYTFSRDFLSLAPLYTYFPLLRPKLDDQGSFYPYPQYHPLYENSGIIQLQIGMSLSNSNSIESFVLSSSYFDGYSTTECYIDGNGQLPSWHSGQCNFTAPFRFVGAASCSDSTTDNWGTEPANKNANYLFKIAKLPLSNTYSIKGVGCNEITQTLDFTADHIQSILIRAIQADSLRTVTLSGFGYAFNRISETLSSEVILENSNETCFVLFSDKIVDNEDDFINIHTAVSESLPNSIICYFGDDSRIPRDLVNKVIHSDAIVTDLDTNEQMPLVIKYIRYAKRLHKLFNE